MYIVTFYSYKGGTGRSMALVNSAIELVKSGLRVLIVDFDLEAPGIDTFNLPKSKKKQSGLVDFVLEYLEDDKTPDVKNFIYKSNLPNIGGGELWIMPAGKPDNTYDSRFKSIDWRDLYEHHEGYLLFEDLKVQWEELDVDYVLIDSRTGHTDVSGICTRQLPDSVVLCFFPNEQNRRGLVTVVKQIREESVSAREKSIKLHFVMSNVPELDDEEGYLANNVKNIKTSLNFDEFSAVIHHYQSLALLNQTIFTLERPRTRLASEYQKLAKAIRKPNLDDRESALEFLDEIISNTRKRSMLPRVLENTLINIQAKHISDKDVLIKLATLFKRQRSFEESLSLLDEAGKLGANTAEFFLMRAELHVIAQNIESAIKDIKILLTLKDVTYLDLLSIVRLLQQRAPEELYLVTNSTAFNELDVAGKTYILYEFLESREALKFAIPALIKHINTPELDESERGFNTNALILGLIGNGQFSDAINIITKDGILEFEELEIIEAFNYAMAQWGLVSKPKRELFQRIIDLDKINVVDGANGHMCLALAFWVINKKKEAKQRLDDSWREILKTSSDFSPWSYMILSRERFLRDLEEVKRLIDGDIILPRFITENTVNQK